MSLKRFYVFGDSITYGAWDKEGGWVQRLRKYLDLKSPESYRVYNLGITIDETTERILNRFESEIKTRTGIEDFEDKNIIVFAVGINDSQYIHKQNKSKCPPKEFENNIKKLINSARKFSSNIFFVGLTPVDESKVDPILWVKEKTSYKNEYVSKYNEIIKSVCKENSISFIEIFEKWIKVNYKKLLVDGVHPNSEGHEKIFEIVKDFLIENKII